MSVTKQQLINLRKGWDKELQLKNLEKGWKLEIWKKGWRKNKFRNGEKNLSKERLLELLVDLKNKLQRVPKQIDAINPYPSASTYKRKFGSWNNALSLMGIEKTVFIEGNYKKPKLSLRFRIFRRDNFTCQYCGGIPQKGYILTLDHKDPKSKNKDKIYKDEDFITACWACNIGKSDKY